MTRKPLLIHIGTHKTGSTSFQHYLRDYAEQYKEHGYAVVPNREAITAACLAIRDELEIPSKAKLLLKNPNRAHLEKNFRDRISEFDRQNKNKHVVLSCEHFSYFRTVEEVDRLLSFFEGNREVYVFAVVRNKQEFLKSYRAQIEKTGHGPIFDDKLSPYYCGRDSWLIDYDGMQAPWAARASEFKSLHYEDADVLRSLVLEMGLPDFRDGQIYRRNVTPTNRRSKAVSMLKQLRLYSTARTLYMYSRSIIRR